jgi:folate-dependent phosphoribosylglycinamide formyltransferase PurN
MNIVFISDYSARELYVVEQVLKKYPAAVVVRPSSSTSDEKKPSASGINKMGRWVNDVGWKVQRKLWNYKFFGRRKLPRPRNIMSIPSDDLNKTAGAKILQSLQPDILITCRAPLLPPEIFTIPSIASINVHYGIAPYYRGTNTLFWALYYNDFGHLGGCIHHLANGIDTGNLLTEIYPALSSSDGEIALDYKTSRLLAKALLAFLSTVEKRDTDINGKPQTEKGRNFNSRDRTLKKSTEQLLKRTFGLSKPPKRDEKIITYY